MAKNFLPIAEALHLHPFLSPMELRKRCVYDIMRNGFEDAMNIVYLGTTAGKNYDYCFYTNFEVNSLADFKGKTFRVAPAYVTKRVIGVRNEFLLSGENSFFRDNLGQLNKCFIC